MLDSKKNIAELTLETSQKASALTLAQLLLVFGFFAVFTTP